MKFQMFAARKVLNENKESWDLCSALTRTDSMEPVSQHSVRSIMFLDALPSGEERPWGRESGVKECRFKKWACAFSQESLQAGIRFTRQCRYMKQEWWGALPKRKWLFLEFQAPVQLGLVFCILFPSPPLLFPVFPTSLEAGPSCLLPSCPLNPLLKKKGSGLSQTCSCSGLSGVVGRQCCPGPGTQELGLYHVLPASHTLCVLGRKPCPSPRRSLRSSSFSFTQDFLGPVHFLSATFRKEAQNSSGKQIYLAFLSCKT